MKSKLAIFILSLIASLSLTECLLQAKFHIKPGWHTYSPWFTEVDTLMELKGMVADSHGIFHVSPEAVDYVNGRLKNYNLQNAPFENIPNASLEIYGMEWDYFELQSDTCSISLARTINKLHAESIYLTAHEKEMLRYSTSPINEEGFRSISFKSGDTTRKKILLLGDSFTWGHDTESKLSSFADLLLQKGYWVYNTGISGADVPQYLAVAKRYIPVLKPDVVIVNFFLGNDVQHYPRKVEPHRPFHYMTSASNLIACPNGIYFENAQEAYDFVCSHYKIPLTSWFNRFCATTALGTAGFMALKRYNLVNAEVSAYKEYWKQAAALYSPEPYCNQELSDIKKLCEQSGSKFILIAIPEQRGKQLITPKQIPLLFRNLKYHIPDVSLKNYNPANGHYNESGHNIHAELINRLVIE
jgi:lysophospholipase L1-like esterase